MAKQALFTWEKLTLKMQNPFTLSYGSSDIREVFWIRLINDEGWGEAAIPPYYGVKQEDMIDFWQKMSSCGKSLPDEVGQVQAWIHENGPRPARCALEMALLDRMARKAGQPLYEFLGLPKPEPKATSFTVAIASPERMAEIASSVPGYPVIKIKMGSEDDLVRLEAVRKARPDAALYVDANAGWTREEAVKYLDAMQAYDLALVEQPLAKEDIEGLGMLQAHTRIPIVADESLQSEADVERIAAAGVRGVNLKIMKLGGILPALRIVQRARHLGLSLMFGQMIETSLATTAMMHLSSGAAWLDLDAPKLITNDPFSGVTYDETARISVPGGPGIGVTLKRAE